MPKLEPKQIQKELEQGQVWPVYWIYGHEKMKARELVKRIRKTIQAPAAAPGGFAGLGLGEERIDGAAASGAAVVEAAQSMTLGGGTRFIVVQDAHELEEADEITSLFGARGSKDELPSVCVFLSKDLDQRKKLSKLLVEKAAVVSCEEVVEADRPAWIEYLAKQRGIPLDARVTDQLAVLDPWSLDIIDQELEKLSLSEDPSGSVLLTGGIRAGASERFIDGFLGRELKTALEALEGFAGEPEEALPLLGLLGWNVRHLAVALADDSSPGRPQRPNSFLADRLRRWKSLWTLEEVERLQEALSDLDFASKQTARLPLGIWTDLVIQFNRA